MLYSGVFVNLDRNPERRARIEAELTRIGLGGRYERVSACDGNPLGFPKSRLKIGEIGCFSSHYKLLDERREQTQPLHVIEDDLVLSPTMERVLDWAIQNSDLDKTDLLFTDVAVPVQNSLCYTYKNFYDTNVYRNADGQINNITFSIIDLKNVVFGSTCSFLVNPKSIGKIADLFGEELRRGADLPVDLFIRRLCYEERLRAHCIFPFVTSIRPESCMASTMEKRFETTPALAANMLRHSFFVDCDLPRLYAEAQQALPQPDEADIHRQILHKLLGYTLTPGYEKC